MTAVDRGPAAPARSSALLSRLASRLEANGPRWLAYHVANRSAQRVADYFARRSHELEAARCLPGWNTVEQNRLAWSKHDWSRGGDEWSESTEWADSLVHDVMHAELPEAAEAIVLEIGPGAGRWTEHLYKRCGRLILADITDTTLSLCRERLGDPTNVSYIVTDGRSLPTIASAGVDFIWSYDVFVHIAPADTKGYIADLARIMRPGARGVVHHPGAGNVDGGWRSTMSSELFVGLLGETGLRVVRQLNSWGPDGRYTVPRAHDIITVFERP